MPQMGHLHPFEPRARGARLLRIAALSAALGAFSTAGGSGSALGLGEISEQSSLGEPLQVTIPVLVNDADLAGGELAPECFRLIASESRRAGDVPEVAFGRVALMRSAQGMFVIVTGHGTTSDPALSLTVEAGCRSRIRRDYTVLLDLPSIRPAVAEPVAVAGPLERRATASSPETAAPRAGASAAKASRSAPPAPAKATRPRATSTAAAPKSASSAARAALDVEANARVGTVREDAAPRLHVSRSAADSTPERSASDIARGKSDAEIRQDLEAETVVLQRRIAELSATLATMEADLRRATAARQAAEHSAKLPAAKPWGPWAWLIALVPLAALLESARRRIRSRQPPPQSLAPLDTPSMFDAGTFGGEPSTIGSLDEAANTSTFGPAVRSAAAAAAAAPPPSDDEASFEEDLLRYAEQRSAYSVLEREHPKVIASIVRDWGKPKVIAYLREILVSPRRTSIGFSRAAVSDLTFLQGLAMERAGYRADDNPWNIDLEGRRRTGAA